MYYLYTAWVWNFQAICMTNISFWILKNTWEYLSPTQGCIACPSLTVPSRDGHEAKSEVGNSSKIPSSLLQIGLASSKPVNLNFPKAMNLGATQRTSWFLAPPCLPLPCSTPRQFPSHCPFHLPTWSWCLLYHHLALLLLCHHHHLCRQQMDSLPTA